MAVIIPALDEEQAIAGTVQGVPEFVDHVIVIDDASSDATAAVAERTARTCGFQSWDVIRHEHNRGVGAAIVTGYRRALACGLDVAAVMAGDGQMDPADLPGLLDPIADGHTDYSKGNRFKDRAVWTTMPWPRIVGNLALSMATKISSGYWNIFDSQCGYTAITASALERIDLDRVFSRYGYPNDFLARLHSAGLRVMDVPVRAIYGPTWKSGIAWHTVIYPVGFVLARSWLTRVATETRRRVVGALPAPSKTTL